MCVSFATWNPLNTSGEMVVCTICKIIIMGSPLNLLCSPFTNYKKGGFCRDETFEVFFMGPLQSEVGSPLEPTVKITKHGPPLDPLLMQYFVWDPGNFNSRQ